MATVADLEKITDVEGVSQYILMTPTGQIISHNLDNPHTLSAMMISCMGVCRAIEANQFRHLVFTQADNRDLFLFPVGKYYLGVFKEAAYEAARLPDNIYSFITNLSRKR